MTSDPRVTTIVWLKFLSLASKLLDDLTDRPYNSVNQRAIRSIALRTLLTEEPHVRQFE